MSIQQQAGLPIKKGRGETMTQDHKRHDDFVFDAKHAGRTGSSQCQNRHTNEDWIAFLRQIDRRTPNDKHLRIIADKYAPYKHVNVRRGLGKHKRFQMRYTPISASWLNVVERFFRDITQVVQPHRSYDPREFRLGIRPHVLANGGPEFCVPGGCRSQLRLIIADRSVGAGTADVPAGFNSQRPKIGSSARVSD